MAADGGSCRPRRVGQDGDPATRRQRLMQQDVGRVDHLGEVSTRTMPVCPSSASAVASGGQLSGSAHGRVTRARPPARRPSERPARPGRPAPRRSACAATPGGRCGRSCAGCRTTRGRAARRRCASSSSQYWSRSLPLTSALLPTATNVEMPSPSRPSVVERWPRRSCPTATSTPMPARARLDVGERGVHRHAGGGVDHAHGVRARPGACRGRARELDQVAAPAAAPSSPASAKPGEITTRPCTRLAAQCSTTWRTSSAGTAITARSMSSGTSSTDGLGPHAGRRARPRG